MSLKALIFDVDGTLANTEQGGHLRAFNEAFKLLNINCHWSDDTYADLLQVTGGKERIAHFMNHCSPPMNKLLSETDIAKIHQLKTDIFVGYVAQGCVTVRTGVKRLVDEAIECGLRLAIATTTSLQNVEAILSAGGMSSKFEVIGAGDVVKNKKPAADIYQYVLDELKLSADECIVFEDSAVGFASASAAGLKTVVTLSEYTKPFAFDGALVVVDHLGEKGAPFQLVSGKLSRHSYVNVEYLKELHEQNR
jgi:HAD superfamily hydrolase (TIGR01509 family)